MTKNQCDNFWLIVVGTIYFVYFDFPVGTRLKGELGSCVSMKYDTHDALHSCSSNILLFKQYLLIWCMLISLFDRREGTQVWVIKSAWITPEGVSRSYCVLQGFFKVLGAMFSPFPTLNTNTTSNGWYTS